MVSSQLKLLNQPEADVTLEENPEPQGINSFDSCHFRGCFLIHRAAHPYYVYITRVMRIYLCLLCGPSPQAMEFICNIILHDQHIIIS